MVILDTNIIIDHLRTGSSKKSLLVKLVETYPTSLLGICVLTIQELYEGKSTRFETKEKELLSTISPLKILPYTYEVAQYAGIIARDLKRPIELADAAIAATVVINNAELYTLNHKDFQGIKDLEFFNPISL